MGGTVFIGIRRRDGAEHLYERWTNSISWWFATAEFVTDGNGVDEFVRNAEEVIASGESIYTKRHRAVTYSEYGVILVDHCCKKILSCQGYVRPGSLMASWVNGYPMHSEDAALITKLHAAGRLEKLIDIREREDIGANETQRILALLAESADGRLPEGIRLGIIACTDLRDFEMSHVSQCGREERRRIRQFLVDNGWKARVYGQKKG